jgi:hypothetical protein
MDIEWGSLFQVFLVSLGATSAVVVIFALGIVATSAREHAREQGHSVTAPTTAAALCFAACAAIVLYGVFLIVPQFH